MEGKEAWERSLMRYQRGRMNKEEDDFVAAKKNLGKCLQQEQHSVHLKTGQFTYDDSLLEQSNEELHHLQ